MRKNFLNFSKIFNLNYLEKELLGGIILELAGGDIYIMSVD